MTDPCLDDDFLWLTVIFQRVIHRCVDATPGCPGNPGNLRDPGFLGTPGSPGDPKITESLGDPEVPGCPDVRLLVLQAALFGYREFQQRNRRISVSIGEPFPFRVC